MLRDGHLLDMLLFSVIGSKQNNLILIDFQENERLFGKMFTLSVGQCDKKYL